MSCVANAVYILLFVSQLKQAEATLKAEDEEIEEVRQEFTVRVAATEKKYQAAAKVSQCRSRNIHSPPQLFLGLKPPSLLKLQFIFIVFFETLH